MTLLAKFSLQDEVFWRWDTNPGGLYSTKEA